MSELRNLDAVANPKQGQFHPGVKPTGPLRNDGHQLGSKITPSDHAPEFSAENHPPGTAPEKDSYYPNAESEAGSQAMNDLVDRSHGKQSTFTTAEQTLMGSTSKDVHKGLGHPGVGETQREIYHDGNHGRKRQTHGLEGVGTYREDRNERRLPDQRGTEREEARGGEHGDKGSLAAEDQRPEPAQTLDNEWKYEPGTKRGSQGDMRHHHDDKYTGRQHQQR